MHVCPFLYTKVASYRYVSMRHSMHNSIAQTLIKTLNFHEAMPGFL